MKAVLRRTSPLAIALLAVLIAQVIYVQWKSYRWNHTLPNNKEPL